MRSDPPSAPVPPEEEAETGAPPTRRDIRDLYRRTWELELLISGAVVFALLQLPGTVDRAFVAAEHQVGAGMESLLFLGYYVSKLILYTLIGAFLAHLIARALWVGLIGLDSVFPRGVRWDRVESGPIMLRVRREIAVPLPLAIRRADAAASVIFSAAFAIVLMLVLIGLMSAVFGAVALAVGVWLGEEAVSPVFWTLYMLAFLPAAVAQIADKALAGRMRPDGAAARWVERMLRTYYRVTGPLARVSDAITSTLSSNLPRYRATAGITIAFGTLIAIFLVRDVLVGSGALRLDGYAYFPDHDGAMAVFPVHYEDIASEERPFSEAPRIQSAVVTGPFVQLFVPIPAARMSSVVRAWCPGAEPVHDPGLRLTRRPRGEDALRQQAAAEAVLACLTGLLDVELDAAPVAAAPVFHVHPASGRRGLLLLLPTGGLADGRHTLVVRPLPRPENDDEDDEDEGPRMPWTIPFWTGRELR